MQANLTPYSDDCCNLRVNGAAVGDVDEMWGRMIPLVLDGETIGHFGCDYNGDWVFTIASDRLEVGDPEDGFFYELHGESVSVVERPAQD